MDFVVYRKAFDRVDGRKLYDTLVDVQTSNQITLAFYKFYKNNSTPVKTEKNIRHGKKCPTVFLSFTSIIQYLYYCQHHQKLATDSTQKQHPGHLVVCR